MPERWETCGRAEGGDPSGARRPAPTGLERSALHRLHDGGGRNAPPLAPLSRGERKRDGFRSRENERDGFLGRDSGAAASAVGRMSRGESPARYLCRIGRGCARRATQSVRTG